MEEANIQPIEEQELIKNCLIYARVSTERQVQEGHSLDDQVNRLVVYAREHNWNILEIFRDEGKSASSTAGRPEFTRMLERCEADREVNAILLEETDRFARNAQDHLAVKSFLKKYNIQLIATQQPNFGDDPVGKFVDLVMAGANQLQREITGEKTRRTMIALAENGFQPGVATIGYNNSFKKGEPWLIDQERVYFIKEMFRRFNSGLSPSIYVLEEELYAEGFRSKNGKRIRANRIHMMLTDVRYAGKVLYRGKMYDGKHDAIVDMADIKKAKATLTKHNKGADRTRKHNWLLAGLIFCKTSGDLMTGEQHIKKSGLIFRHYRCLGPKNYGNPCNEPYAPMEKVNGQVETHMKSIKFGKRFLDSLREALLETMQEQGKDTPARIEAFEVRKAIVEKKMDKLEDQMISDLVPRERIEPKYVPLREELKSIEGQIAQLKRPSANLDEKKIDTIIAFLKDFPKLWSAFQPEEKKQFLKWFVEKVWVQNKEVVGIDHTEAFQACIERDLVRIKSTWLERWNDFYGSNWIEVIDYPDVVMQQSRQLLSAY